MPHNCVDESRFVLVPFMSHWAEKCSSESQDRKVSAVEYWCQRWPRHGKATLATISRSMCETMPMSKGHTVERRSIEGEARSTWHECHQKCEKEVQDIEAF